MAVSSCFRLRSRHRVNSTLQSDDAIPPFSDGMAFAGARFHPAAVLDIASHSEGEESGRSLGAARFWAYIMND